MDKQQFQILLGFFKALADESRLKIVGILAKQECSVEELAALLQLKEPTISHHLTKLNQINLVKMRPEGNSHFYQLDSETLNIISKEIFTPTNMASWVENIETEPWESKILKNYISGDNLKEIPASRKKRFVILKWLVNQFEIKVRYPERMVNEIIKRHHPDCATLRRELIGCQLMQRSDGVYWRLGEDC